jgi:hypothetical protein
VTEREDPLSFVLRNRPAREVLEQLQGKPLMIPIDLRKSVGLHPETFRRLVSDLDEFALITIRALPRPREARRRTPGVLRIPVGVEITDTGRNLLEVTRGVRETVRRHARLLPEASAEHWLLA